MLYHFTITRLARQKTLSVKWHQSMSETKFYEKRAIAARRLKENQLRPPQLPKLSDSHEYISRQESLPSATTPLMTGNSNLNAINPVDNVKCDCALPDDDCITTTTVKFRQSTLDIDAAKSSDNC